MGKPFSDISRGGELKVALDNYNTYKTNLSTRTTSRVTGAGTPKRRISVPVAIYPFSVGPLAGGQTFEKYVVRMSKAAFAGTGTPAPFGKSKIDNYFDDTLTGTIDPPTGFSAARVSTFESTGAAAYKQSKYTKLYYSRTPGVGYHYPIGRNKSSPATADEKDVKKTLQAALADEIQAAPSNQVRRVSFKDEKMGGLR